MATTFAFMILVCLVMIVLSWVKVIGFFYYQRFGTKKVYRGIKNFKKSKGSAIVPDDSGLDIKKDSNSEIDLSNFDNNGPEVRW